MRLERRAVGTTAVVGAVVVIAIAVGGLAYYIGQMGTTASPALTVTSTTTSTVGGGPGPTSTVTSTSTGSTTVTTTVASTSTVLQATTKTVTSISTTYTRCQGCVDDGDDDGV